jgi:hypothetical protein
VNLERAKTIVARLVGLVAIASALTLAGLVLLFALFLAGAFVPSRPWAFAVLRWNEAMIIRVHDGTHSQDWLIPGFDVDGPDALFLAVSSRPTGPIELLDPADCRVVAQAPSPQDGRGVLVSYWLDGESERWVLHAGEDTMSDSADLKTGIASIPACRRAT